MTSHDPLDETLRDITGLTSHSGEKVSLDAMWQRAGELQLRRDARRRTALTAGLFAVGLGTGVVMPQTAAMANDTPNVTLSGSDLAPADLLHVTR